MLDKNLHSQPKVSFRSPSLLDVTSARLAFENKGPRHDTPIIEINENGVCSLEFNVMDNKRVSEKIFINKYRIWPGYIEAEFNREYISQMTKSPSHLIFLTGLIHCQRIIYVYLTAHFGLSYINGENEKFKIWPTGLSIDLSTMITNTDNIIHKVLIESLVQVGPSKHNISVKSKFNDQLELTGSCAIYDIR